MSESAVRVPSTRASRLKTRVQGAEVPGADKLRTLAVGVVVIGALYLAREVLVPITLAVLLSFVLGPMVGRLRRWGVWRVPAVLVSVLVAMAVIVALTVVIGGQLASLGSRASLYAYTIQQKIEAVQAQTTDRITALQDRLGRGVTPPKPAEKPKKGDEPKPVTVEVHEPDPAPMTVLRNWATPILGPLSSLGIVLVVAVFILMQKEDLRDRMIRLFGSGDLHRTTAAMDDAATRLSRYFLTQLAVNAGFGVVTGLGLFFIGVPSPALFGIMAALLRFVPYVGAIAAALLPILLAAAVDPGWTMVVEAALLFLVIETLTGQALEPMLYGHNTGLSPVSVVVAAIFWAWLWGPVGLILSMPLTLCLVVLGRHFKPLEFIDVLLGDTPALTPGEGFYQRMLAGDADEVVDQAEAYLKDKPLSAYYDEVAMTGLHMAANDALRGVLTPQQLENIEQSVGAVMLDLAAHPDTGAHAAPGAALGTVLCVGGCGPLDEIVCGILAQLLAKRGVPTQTVSRTGVARGTIDTLETEGVGVICVSWLEGSGSLSGLRHLVRRLRARAPGLPVMLGLWQVPLDEDSLGRLRAVVEADEFVAGIGDALDACVRHVSPAVDVVQQAGVDQVGVDQARVDQAGVDQAGAVPVAG